MMLAAVRPLEMAPALWSEGLLVLAIAAWLDFLVGDPWSWPHPVQGMGWVINRYSQWILAFLKQPMALRIAGIGLGLGLILGSGALGWSLVEIAGWLHPVGAIAVQTVLLASCFAGRSLRHAAEDVLAPVAEGDLATARSRLSQYVGRDTDDLDQAEILRAVLETVSENSTDGVTAPLFYAILGACLPVLGPLPLALGYKAASTLDSMVGYKEAPYTDLGWFSARLEDFLTWLPCRLTVMTVALLAQRPIAVLRLCQRDAPQDPSPNAGWSECAYAAALGVQVGGTNQYRGQVKVKPLLADALEPITPDKVRDALRLTRWTVLLWLAIAAFVLLSTDGFL